MKRVALYVRVSTAEQKNHGLSVENQIEALKAYSNDNNYQIVDIYNDAGISARKKYTRRPELLRMVEDCAAGKVDLVLFTKLDRFFRSVADYYEVQSKLEKYHVPWRAIWEDYETETSAGVFKVNIMLSVAQAESDRTSERIKAVNEYRRASGKYIGKAPVGYKSVNSMLCKNESEREAIEAFFECFKTTRSVKLSAFAARKHGVKITKTLAKRILTSQTYCGKANGHICEPYITEEEYEEYKAVVKNKSCSYEKTGNVHIFSGLMRCEKCGKKMVVKHTYIKRKNNDDVYKYDYYRCYGAYNYDCDMKSQFSQNSIERILLEKLDDYLADYKADIEVELLNIEDNEKLRESLEQKLKRIGDRYEDGDITIEEYRAKRDKIKGEINSIPKRTKQLPVLPDNWKEVYNMLNQSSKKSFWASIIKVIYISRIDKEPVLRVIFL